MHTSSASNLTALNLLFAASLLLGGASVAKAQAQDAPADPSLGLRGVVLEPPAEPKSAESLASHPTCVVFDNGHRALIQGAALHDSQYGSPAAVAVEVINFDSQHTLHALTAGDDGFFSLVVDVTPRIYAVRVAVAEQPDATSRCKGTNVAVVGQ